MNKPVISAHPLLPTDLTAQSLGPLLLPDKTHISAASGLEFEDGHLLVVTDDELFLGVFPFSLENLKLSVGTPLTLFPNRPPLPKKPKERKALKPDLEGLSKISENLFLALPSGSTSKREKGVAFYQGGAQNGKIKEINFTSLFQEIRKNYFTELNLEGISVGPHGPYLFQRGNGSTGINGIIELDATVFEQQLQQGEVTAEVIKAAQEIDLGHLGNTILTFSDVYTTPEGVFFFLASAEEGKSTYKDGEFMGTTLGVLKRKSNGQFYVYWSRPFTEKFKAEGIWARLVNDHYQVFLVTDGDDRKTAATLYTISIPTTWTK